MVPALRQEQAGHIGNNKCHDDGHTVPHDIVAKTAAAAATPLYVCLET
jgi:hypothetical protein